MDEQKSNIKLNKDINVVKEEIVASRESNYFDIYNLKPNNSADNSTNCTIKEKEFSIVNNMITNPEKIINEIKGFCILRCFICSRKENLKSSKLEVMCNKCNFRLKYECLKCHKLFSSSDYFYIHKNHCCDFAMNENKQHRKNFQKEILMLQCKTCAFVTTQNHKLLEHIKTKHIIAYENNKNNNNIENNTDLNNGDFLHKSDIIRFSITIGETKLESTQRSYIMSCPNCDQPSDVVSTRKAVICDKCEIPKNYRCLICDKRCTSYQNINYHVRACADNKFYYCSSCKYKSVHKHNLLKHVLKVHISKQNRDQTQDYEKTNYGAIKNQNNYAIKCSYLQCRFCSLRLRFDEELRLHLNNEHKDCVKTLDIEKLIEEIIEEGQKATRSTPIELKRKRSYTKKLRGLYCAECDELFNNESKMPTRCKKCNNDLVLRCLVCSGIFKSHSSIYGHLKSKCASSDYLQCTECDITVSWHSNDLEKFLPKHSFVNISTFKECGQCGLKFTYKDDMISHILHHCSPKKALTAECKSKNNIQSQMKNCGEKREWNIANKNIVLTDEIKKQKTNNNVYENGQEITIIENSVTLENGEIVIPDDVEINENSVILLYIG